MKKKSTSILRAKELRKNMPDAEKKFWHAINYGKLGVKFRRQQPIGPYYADFICFELKLIIELDGNQHITAEEYDNRRTDFITAQGYKIMRIPNDYIYNDLDAVVMHLQHIINGDIDMNEYFKDKYDFGVLIPPPKIS